MRSTIIGDGGRANEAQSEFLALVENAIKQPDLAKSVQRYQLALDETKPRVNFAVIPGGWLHDVYENGDKHRNSSRLQQQNHAGNSIHKARHKQRRKHRDKKVGLRLMDGGTSKINPPNSHPSNPIHKALISRKRRRPLLPPPPLHPIQYQPPQATT